MITVTKENEMIDHNAIPAVAIEKQKQSMC